MMSIIPHSSKGTMRGFISNIKWMMLSLQEKVMIILYNKRLKYLKGNLNVQGNYVPFLPEEIGKL